MAADERSVAAAVLASRIAATPSSRYAGDRLLLALERRAAARARHRPSRGRAGTSTRPAGSRRARRSAGDERRCSPRRRPRSSRSGTMPFAGDRPGVDPGPRREDDAVALLEAPRSGVRASLASRRAVRTARSASSSWSSVRPKTAITASPMNFASTAAVPLDDRLDALEVVRQNMREGLRIESLPQTGRIDDIGEEDRDRLPKLLR